MYPAPHTGWDYIGQKDSLQSQTHVNTQVACEPMDENVNNNRGQYVPQT